MEHWQLIHSATRISQQLRLVRAARVQAESAAKIKDAQGQRQSDGLDPSFRRPSLAA